mgnify:CR=1
LNFAFAKIPIGIHTMFAFIALSSLYILLSVLLRQIVETILPFEVVILAFVNVPVGDLLYGMIKFIPVKDDRTG